MPARRAKAKVAEWLYARFVKDPEITLQIGDPPEPHRLFCGSTFVTVEVDEAHGTVRVLCRAWVLSGSPLTRGLMDTLLRLNAQAPFGAFGILATGDVVFQHAILAAELDRDELVSTVEAVARAANAADDDLAHRFGGHTAVRLKSLGFAPTIAGQEAGPILRWLLERGCKVREFDNPNGHDWDGMAQVIGKRYPAMAKTVMAARWALVTGKPGFAVPFARKDGHYEARREALEALARSAFIKLAKRPADWFVSPGETKDLRWFWTGGWLELYVRSVVDTCFHA